MRITTDLDATVLFIIAKDITKMEALLDIDESDIGDVKKGQKVKLPKKIIRQADLKCLKL